MKHKFFLFFFLYNSSYVFWSREEINGADLPCCDRYPNGKTDLARYSLWEGQDLAKPAGFHGNLWPWQGIEPMSFHLPHWEQTSCWSGYAGSSKGHTVIQRSVMRLWWRLEWAEWIGRILLSYWSHTKMSNNENVGFFCCLLQWHCEIRSKMCHALKTSKKLGPNNLGLYLFTLT